jgi:hypothetical protein
VNLVKVAIFLFTMMLGGLVLGSIIESVASYFPSARDIFSGIVAFVGVAWILLMLLGTRRLMWAGKLF